MKTTSLLSLVAQIKQGDLPYMQGLPNDFSGNNPLQKGLIIAYGIAGGIALIIVAYGGLKYVISQGNPQEITKAKDTLLYGMIGLAVIIFSGGIIAFVINRLT